MFISAGDLWTTDTTVGAAIGCPKGTITEKQCVPRGKSLDLAVSNVLDDQWSPLQTNSLSAGHSHRQTPVRVIGLKQEDTRYSFSNYDLLGW